MGLAKILETRNVKNWDLLYLEIANKIGVTEATVQRWESGEIKTLRPGAHLPNWQKDLEVSPAQLMRMG